MAILPPEILADKRLAALAKKYGAAEVGSYYPTPGTFRALLRSIIYQQLSGKAAATIHGRFETLFPRRIPTPELLLALTDEQLRSVGLSHGKVVYVRDLAQKFVDGSIPHKKFAKLASEEIMQHLTTVKGIGEWTVHMFLMFTLGRPDVLPTGDLAIRKAFQKVYRLKEAPTTKRMEQIAKPWRSQASIASWYLWKVMDEKE